MTSHDFAVRRGFEWPFPEGFFLFGWPRIYGGLWGFHGFIPKWMADVQAGGIEGYSISIQTHLLFFESRGYFWMGVHTFIDWLLACSTSIDSMGYIYIYIYIYSLDLCVGGVWLPSFVYIQGGAIPWDIHWICVLLAMLGPHRIFTGGITEQFPISSWTIPVGSSKWSIFSAGWLCRVYRCLSVYASLSRPFLKKKKSIDVHSFSHQDSPTPAKIPPSPQEDFGLCGHCSGDFASRQLGICEVARGYCQVFLILPCSADCACESVFFWSVHSWKIWPKTAIFMRKFIPFQRFWENIE